MNLSDEQKQQVAAWVHDGLGLAEVQRRLENDFGLRVTFMEVRFLVDDLDLDLTDPEPPAPVTPPEGANAAAGAAQGGTPAPQPGDAELENAFGGAVSVSVDALQRPGALVSGSVTFSDGETMGWQLDQSGRLGLLPGKTEGYRPGEEDIAAFQVELEKVLQRQGF